MADPASIKAELRAALRDYNVEGVPASGLYEVEKDRFRDALEEVVDYASASGASIVVATLAQLEATVGSTENARAEVRDDPGGDAVNGVYGYQSGSWVRISDLLPPDVATDLEEATTAAIQRERPRNLFANGALRAGRPTPLFSDLLSAQSAYAASVESVADATLAKYGLTRAMVVPAATGTGGGDRIYQDVRLEGGRVFFAVLIKTITGGWDMGSNATWNGPSAWLRYTDGASTVAKLTSYTTPGAGVRLYSGVLVLTAGKVCQRIELGLVPTTAHADAFALAGFWASHTLAIAPTLANTAWPDWTAANQDVPTDLADRISMLERATTLGRAIAKLKDPMSSVGVCFIGDSQTWGLKASGATADSPRNHALADPRNTIDAAVSPSWANLLSRWMMRTFNRGAIAQDDPGEAHSRATMEFNPALDPTFRVINRPTGGRQLKGTGTNASARLNTYLDLSVSSEQALAFQFTGDNLTIVRAQFATPNNSYIVEVDGVVEATISYTAATATFGQVDNVTLDYGVHDVVIYPVTGSSNALRIEAVRSTRRLRVKNQGIIGTNTGEWLPGQPLYTGALDAADDVVVIDLGTNDRNTYLSAARTEANLRTMVSALVAAGRIVILQTPCQAVSDLPEAGYNFDLGSIAAVVRKIGAELGVSVIDNHASISTASNPAALHPVGDTLHFNDVGQAQRFRNMVLAFGGVISA